jgi:hypothetical protein
MCKTSKGTQVASSDRLRKVPPNGSVVGGTPGSPGSQPVVLFDGRPEHVPELTYIVQRRRPNDDFINGANTYHTNCGLQPQTITSIENLVNLLSASTSLLRRIRIVTHAHPTNMAVDMFERSNVFQTLKKYLRGFARDDVSGIYAVLGMNRGQHFIVWDIGNIISRIRSQAPNVLTPFGLSTSGTPPSNLREYIFFCSDHFFVRTNNVKKNNNNLQLAEKNSLLSALSIVIQQTGNDIVGTTFGAHQIIQADLDALRTFVFSMTLADFGFSSIGSYNFTVPPDADDPFLILGRAVVAIQNNFRTRLNQVKQRFDEKSTIDIRGCRVGQDLDYLQAVREFFGNKDHLPQVTAPQWYQYFGPCNHSDLQNNAQIRALLQTGANAADVRAGFDDWARRAQIDSAHKKFWIDLLNDSVIRFCQMNWRTTLPQLPLQTPGLTAFAALSFQGSIGKIQEFFNIAVGPTPSGAALNNIDNFVTNSLSSYAPNLLAQVNASTSAASLQGLYQALRQINQSLGQSLVPAVAPTPLRASDITGYQTALIGFIESNQLAPIRAFMTAAKQRIQDTADPGIFYYMLHIGLPVFVFANRETVNNHIVTVTNNLLVVLHTYADTAYRQWPPLLWVEPLPSSNTIGTMRVMNRDARRFAMMVEAADGGNTRVASCPHPDYMNQIASVP